MAAFNAVDAIRKWVDFLVAEPGDGVSGGVGEELAVGGSLYDQWTARRVACSDAEERRKDQR